ncbi:hypothetical protein D3C71_1829490 [compost metagenome]
MTPKVKRSAAPDAASASPTGLPSTRTLKRTGPVADMPRAASTVMGTGRVMTSSGLGGGRTSGPPNISSPSPKDSRPPQ